MKITCPHRNRESFGYSLSAIADATARRSVAYLPLQIRNVSTDCVV